MSDAPTLGFIGGTGPQGRGLAMRFAMAGHRCVLGSRTLERAASAAEKVQAHLEDAGVADQVPTLPVGMENADAAACEVAFVVVPYEAQETTLPPLAARLADKVVVSCVNALGVDERGPYPRAVTAGSAAEECAALLPEAQVVGGFQSMSAATLRRLDRPVDADVLLTGDDQGARERVAHLAGAIPGMRPVHVGPLRLSAPVEDMVAVLVAVNKRYRTHSGLRLANLPDPGT